MHSGTYADDCICERVRQHRCYIVATCDRDLRRRLRKVSQQLAGFASMSCSIIFTFRWISLSASGRQACQHIIEGIPVQVLCLCPLLFTLNNYVRIDPTAVTDQATCSSPPVRCEISPAHHVFGLLGSCLLLQNNWVYFPADSWRACHVSAVAQIHNRAAARSNNGRCSQNIMGHFLQAPWPAEDMHRIPQDLTGAMGCRGGKASQVIAANTPDEGALWPAEQTQCIHLDTWETESCRRGAIRTQ